MLRGSSRSQLLRIHTLKPLLSHSLTTWGFEQWRRFTDQGSAMTTHMLLHPAARWRESAICLALLWRTGKDCNDISQDCWTYQAFSKQVCALVHVVENADVLLLLKILEQHGALDGGTDLHGNVEAKPEAVERAAAWTTLMM